MTIYFFRFGRHYEIPLLIQSILMTLAMLALIRVCVQVNKKDFHIVGSSSKERVFSGNTILIYKPYTKITISLNNVKAFKSYIYRNSLVKLFLLIVINIINKCCSYKHQLLREIVIELQ